jgi:hypothetical protein
VNKPCRNYRLVSSRADALVKNFFAVFLHAPHAPTFRNRHEIPLSTHDWKWTETNIPENAIDLLQVRRTLAVTCYRMTHHCHQPRDATVWDRRKSRIRWVHRRHTLFLHGLSKMPIDPNNIITNGNQTCLLVGSIYARISNTAD